MFEVRIEMGGLLVTYSGTDTSGEKYVHPYFGDNYVWSCEEWEIDDIFGTNSEDNIYPYDDEVLSLLDSSGILSDLGLVYCGKEVA